MYLSSKHYRSLIFSKPTSHQISITLAVLFTYFILCLSSSFAAEWIYTVQHGDDLWSLSKKYLISIRYRERLQTLNQIKDPIHIPAGTKLRIPMEWLKSGSSIARITHIKGRVSMISGETGEVHPVTKGTFLWEKDTLRTGSCSSATLEFSDGSRIQLQSDSRLLLEVIKSYGNTGMADTRVKLLKGRTRNKVIPKSGPGSRFEIITPSAAAAVRGTEYRITVPVNNDSRAEVLKGEVALDSQNVSLSLPSGFGSVAHTDSPPLQPVKLLLPPVVNDLPERITQIPTKFSIEKLEGATAYRLQISRDDSFAILSYNGTSTSTKITLPDLPDGKLYLRLRGIDKNGLEGFESVHQLILNAHPIPPNLLVPATKSVIKNQQPLFTWSTQPEASTYVFQLADNIEFTQVMLETKSEETTHTLTEPLDPGLYFWRVASLLSSGKQGPFSIPLSFQVALPVPDLARAQYYPQKKIFSWENSNPEDKYRIQISTDDSFTNIFRDVTVSDPEYLLNDLKKGDYFIRTAIINQNGFQGMFSEPKELSIKDPLNPWIPPLVLLATLLAIL